jgi:hypothetical protein
MRLQIRQKKKIMQFDYKILLFLGLLFGVPVVGQDTIRDSTFKEVITPKVDGDEIGTTKVSLAGKIYTAMITEDGDTLILADLDDISVTSFRTFESDADYQKYMKFRRYALVVFPYAKEAIRIYREWEYASQYMGRREKKRKLKALEEELTVQFEEPLKKLTKLQGKIMIKMIEKETGKSMHTILKDIKGWFPAFYWHNFSKLYTYDLKEGYNRGQYEILDAVLDDFDVSHRIDSNNSLKYITIDKFRKK